MTTPPAVGDADAIADADDVARLIRAHAPGGTTGPVRVGLECEWLVVEVDDLDRVRGRVALEHTRRLLEEALSPVADAPAARVAPDGGAFTLEPGGQVEFSSRPHERLDAAVAEVASAHAWLTDRLGSRRRLVAVGVDPWHHVADVPQQLAAPRYEAMADHFRRREGLTGPGAQMMRNTCATQVNLDLDPDDPLESWWVATLVAPGLGALLGNGAPDRPGRREVWNAIGPARAGSVLRTGSDLDVDPLTLLVRRALETDLMMTCEPDGGMRVVDPGLCFGAWMRRPHLLGRPPTQADLAQHLSTVWPDVRTRGFLEVRTVDSMPVDVLPGVGALLVGLVLDARARGVVRDRLDLRDPRCWSQWQRWRTHGLDLQEGRWLLETGLEGAERQRGRVVSAADVECGRRLLEVLEAGGQVRDASAMAGSTPPVGASR